MPPVIPRHARRARGQRSGRFRIRIDEHPCAVDEHAEGILLRSGMGSASHHRKQQESGNQTQNRRTDEGHWWRIHCEA